MLRVSSRPRRRVVVDTNSWISNFIGPHSLVAQRLGRLLANDEVQVLFSEGLREEILRVVQRPKFSRYISPAQLAIYVRQIRAYLLTPVTSVVTACRDDNDNFLLALCQDGHANFLITGDQDLLVLGHFGSTRILSWAEAEAEPSLLATA